MPGMLITTAKDWIKKWGAYAVSLLSALLYIIQSINIAHSTNSILDESAYLYKGFLFITGQYTPYQAYGPWTNKMPLSFLIPGAIQSLFEPGLATGRYFSIVLGMLTLVGLWLLAYRFGGKWWAAVIVFIMAINPDVIYTYSLAVSQVIVACMMVWMLLLVLGRDRKTWQIILGSILASLIVLTRINMLFVIPLLVLYIYWEHGKRIAVISVFTCLIPIVVINWIYWPEILTRYAFIVPRDLTPFLDPYRTEVSYQTLWNPEILPVNRLLSVLQTARIHFTTLIGVLIAWILWPRKSSWNDKSEYRAAVFLSLLFISLFIFHAWVALGNDFCIYCLSGYTAFFSFTGLLLVIITLPKWRRHIPVWQQVILFILIFLFAVLSGFGSFPEIGNQLLELRIPESLADFPEMEFITLRKYMKVELNIEFREARRIISTIFGIAIGVLILILSYAIWFRKVRRATRDDSAVSPPSLGYLLILVFLIIGTLIPPLFYYSIKRNACDQSIIQAYSKAGEHLSDVLPHGALVYWAAGDSMTPLLQVPDVKIFPPQINGAYSFKTEGDNDTELLLRLGYWNGILRDQWLKEADVVLVQDKPDDADFILTLTESWDFIELESTPPLDPCDENTRIRIFLRHDP